jgi:hypothetical protein
MSARAGRLVSAAIVVLGAVATIAFAAHVARKPGVYYSEVQLFVLSPRSAAYPNTIVNGSQDTTAIAGALAKMTDPSAPQAEVVSPTVTLVDEGIRNGYRVTLPNDGGQFAVDFDQPLLDLQAVGPTAQQVQSTITALESRINRGLSHLQARAHVSRFNLIRTQPTPSTPQVAYLTGSRPRAIATSCAIGVGLTAAALYLQRRRLSGRPRRPSLGSD